MKRDIARTLIGYFIFAFVSCSYENSFFTFPEEKELVAEMVPIKEMLYIIDEEIKGNYLFLANDGIDPMVYVYQLPDLSFVRKYGYKGRGPDEFISFPCFVKSNNESLYVNGYTDVSIHKFEIDSFSNTYRKHIYELSGYFLLNSGHIINDSILLYDESIILKHQLPSCELIGELVIPNREKRHFSDPENGRFIANDSLIIYYYLNKRQVSVYNCQTLELLNTFIDKKALIDLSKRVIYFSKGQITRKHFYLLDRGEYSEDPENGFLYINKYDLDLNPVTRYRLDRNIHTFEVSEKHNLLIGINYDNQDNFIKYKL